MLTYVSQQVDKYSYFEEKATLKQMRLNNN